jgi:Uma2 family endonuclease
MGEPLAKNKVYTYQDYLSWPKEKRVEIIEGEIYDMAAAPSRYHQDVSGELFRQLANFLKKKSCRAYAAPFDVRLSEHKTSDGETTTVVQPDILVVCDKEKLDERGCKGTPDFIAEIVSSKTASKDHIQKVHLYEKYGVREYWILHPTDRLLTIRVLDETGKYSPPQFIEGKGKLALHILPEIDIDLDEVFENV